MLWTRGVLAGFRHGLKRQLQADEANAKVVAVGSTGSFLLAPPCADGLNSGRCSHAPVKQMRQAAGAPVCQRKATLTQSRAAREEGNTAIYRGRIKH